MKKIHRFFYNSYEKENGFIKIIDREIINQISRVIKLKNNEKIIIFNNSNEEICEIKEIDSKYILVSVLETRIIKKDDVDINLYCAVLKKDNFETVIQKATELGVTNIYPIITERTIKTNLNFDRLDKIIKESCEQSGRLNIPNVFDITNLKDLIVDNDSLNILFNMDGENIMKNIDNISKHKNINIFIGPEGGWTEKEVLFFRKNNFRMYCLSKNVLRAETAAMFGVGIISLIKNN